MPKKIKELVSLARKDRQGSTSKLNYEVAVALLNDSFNADDPDVKLKLAKEAREYLHHVFRAEKNSDTELLEELKEQIEEISSRKSIEDL